MAVEIITKEDLQHFRLELLNDIKQLLKSTVHPQKEWLKGTEVRKLLDISNSTLQNLRISGKLHSSKIGGRHYYYKRDIEQMLNSHYNSS